VVAADERGVAHTCIKHPHEPAEGLCRTCGAEYCADCIVYPFGPTKPPYCIPCAVAAGGLRANAGSRPVVVPKENKRRMKEWRKARKRDLESPPPDGVATWQRMDEAATEEEELAAAAKAAAEREALRLPPPAPETPTPPPGVNLAPPGPPGEDWRNELNQGQEETPLLGFLDDDEPPAPLLDPIPQPTDQVDLPAPGQEEFGMSSVGGYDPRFAPVEEPTPLAVPDPEPLPDDLPAPAFDIGRPAYEPTPFVEPPSYEPVAAQEPDPAYEPVTFEPTMAYEPTARPDAPVAFEPSVDPLAASFGTPPPAVHPDDVPPLPPATSLDDFGLGNDRSAPPAMPFADDPLPPPPAATPPPAPAPAAPAIPVVPQRVVDATPAAQAAAAAAPPPPPAPETFQPLGGDATPPPAIRPRTPTRIPAAKPEGKEGDAKAMLARIAALRDKD
jgi:hypothetical protein